MESELSIRWFRLKIPRKRCLTVTHSGRLFSDLQEIYCLENKHVHQKEPTQKKAKDKFGRSITLTLINIFHKSCPICVEDKKQKDANNELNF
jgi:predicted nucleotide-binding protein (sugar kinase/HSP70/actin superfamily)